MPIVVVPSCRRVCVVNILVVVAAATAQLSPDLLLQPRRRNIETSCRRVFVVNIVVVIPLRSYVTLRLCRRIPTSVIRVPSAATRRRPLRLPPPPRGKYRRGRHRRSDCPVVR